MAKDPAINWYFDNWDGGTKLFTRHQKGCYIDVLSAQFHSGPLSLENIKTVLGSDFQAVWPIISKKFIEENGHFFNERLETERKKRVAYSESRSKNRKKKDMNNISNSYEKHMNNIPEIGIETGTDNESETNEGGTGETKTFIHVEDEKIYLDKLQEWFDETFFIQKDNWQKIYPLANIPDALKEFGLEKGFTTFTDESHFRNAFNLKLKNIQDKNGTKNRTNGTSKGLTPPEPKSSGVGFGSL